MKKIGIASDHAGYEMKEFLVGYLDAMGYDVLDFGPHSPESVDYPDFAHPLAEAIEKGEATITATSNGHEASCKVTVVAAPAQIQIAGTINVIKGRVVDIPAPVVNTDGDVCETTLSLSTSNKKYVAVSGTQIKGVRAGSATVTVRAYNGVSARVKVVVWEKPTDMNGVSMDGSTSSTASRTARQ